MKYIFIGVEHYPLPLAKHIQDEGYHVDIGIVDNKNDLGIKGTQDREKPEEKKVRLSYYDGIIEKKTSREVLEMMKKIKNKDEYFVFFDYNDMFNLSDQARKMGFRNGLFPTAFYYRMEEQRELAKEFAKRYMVNIKVADYLKFKEVGEGIKYINDSPHVLVLKSNGKSGDTIVPKTEKLETAKDELVFLLKKNKAQYEENGFILEKKISNCFEVTPVIVFYNGKPVYSLVEFENKEFGAGNIGPLKGGNLVVSVRTDLRCKINTVTFPPVIYKMAAQQPGISVYDAGLLWNGKDFYFTEFCGMRYGWDGIISEIAMEDQGQPFTAKYFEDLRMGKNPLVNKFGVGVRLFNYEGHTHDSERAKSDIPIRLESDVKNNLFWYRVRKDNEGELVSIGGQDMLGVVAASGNTLEEAADRVYEFIKPIKFDKIYYRPKFDLLSRDYNTSVYSRMEMVKGFI